METQENNILMQKKLPIKSESTKIMTPKENHESALKSNCAETNYWEEAGKWGWK